MLSLPVRIAVCDVEPVGLALEVHGDYRWHCRCCRSILGGLALCQVCLEIGLCLSALICFVLGRVHCVFEQLLVVQTGLPVLGLHP